MSDAERFYATALCLLMLGVLVMFYGAIAINRANRRGNKQPDPITVANDFHDDLDTQAAADVAEWERELRGAS